jgi:site-specific recombinase XerD
MPSSTQPDSTTPNLSPQTIWLKRFEDALHARRLAPSTALRYQQIAAHFFSWWRVHRSTDHAGAVAAPDIDTFLTRHLRRCRCAQRCRRTHHENRAALRHLWRVGPESTRDSVPGSPVEAEVRRYETYLCDVCGVAEATRASRVRYVGAFLKGVFGGGAVDHTAVSAAALRSFVMARAKTCRPSSTGVIASALRSYVRWLALEGLVVHHLYEAVPAAARWRLATVPRHLQPEECDRLLQSFHRQNPRGRRDYAMTRCLMDLGLRAGEVAGLRLNDIDWRAATLTIHATKTHRSRVLPMPDALGRALVSYLHVRPTTTHRYLFVRFGVLHGDPIAASVVRSAVRLGYRRASLPRTYTGTHRLRHTAATQLVSAGASLKEVADILGHQSLDSTAIYTKVDLPRLRSVAFPWDVA